MLLVVTTVFVLGVSLLDFGLFFEAEPIRWLLAAVYLMFVAGLVRWSGRGWILVLAACAWTVVVLPRVRWNDGKSFYLDAHRLRIGMTVEQVRELMAPHLELGGNYVRSEDDWWVPTLEEYPPGTLVFFHSPRGWIDHGKVTTHDGVVTAIEIVKD